MSDKDTAIVATGLGQLLQQFEGSVNFRKLCTSYLAQAQAFEDAIWPLLGERGIDNMTGHRLDGLGQIVKLARAGRNDTDYRAAIKIELLILRSNGTAEELLTIVQLMVNMPTADYEFREYDPKTVYFRPVNYDISAAIARPAFFALKRSVSAATQVLFVYALRLDSVVFTLSSLPSTVQTSASLGLANDGQTTGGHLSQAAD